MKPSASDLAREAEGVATFAIQRNLRRTLFRPFSIQVNYVYIYI